MNPTMDISDNQIKQLGFIALKRELGITGFLRFIQQYEKGHGNYTNDREEWQKTYDVEKLASEIIKSRS